MAKDVNATVQKQIRRLQGATEEIRAGVEGVQIAPGKLAAENSDRYLSGIQKNVDKWKANVASVSLPSWKEAIINKGIPRIAEGIAQSADKLTAFHTQLAAYQATYLPALKRQKVLSQADADRNMLENAHQMAKFRFVRK